MRTAADRVASTASRLHSNFSASYTSAEHTPGLILEAEAALRELKKLTRNLACG
jgi:hypothetical protein